MTLIVAADVQDHLLLAGDHCAVLSRVSNDATPDVVIDNYQKIYLWKYGAIAASGDVFLMLNFHQIFQAHERLDQPLDLLEIARMAKEVRARNGIGADRSTGNIFFTLPARDGFVLHLVCIREDSIECEVVEPISVRFSMRKGLLDHPTYDAFVARLRPSLFFREADQFHRYHIDLLRQFFFQHSTLDELITASFDVYMLDKRTGMGMLWHVAQTPGRPTVNALLAQ